MTVDSLLLASALLLGRPASPQLPKTWFGVWRLDTSRSHFIGPSITIKRVPAGYLFDFGATHFTIGEDGRDYLTIDSRTTSLKRTGDRNWLRVHKVNGREVDRSTIALSPDEQRMLIETVPADSGANTHPSRETLARVGTGSGLAGTWRSTSQGINVSRVISVADEDGTHVRWSYPEEGQYYVLLPDGVPSVNRGPHAVPGVTLRLSLIGNEAKWTEYLDGKPYMIGLDHVSANGKYLEEKSWPAQRPTEVQDAIYTRDRQRSN